jgi:hypothetical protein
MRKAAENNNGGMKKEQKEITAKEQEINVNNIVLNNKLRSDNYIIGIHHHL